jgi:hypothetical protein
MTAFPASKQDITEPQFSSNDSHEDCHITFAPRKIFPRIAISRPDARKNSRSGTHGSGLKISNEVLGTILRHIWPRQPGRPFMAKSLESLLAHVSQDRRGFLKTLLVGSAVAAVPMITTQAVAAEGEGEEGKDGKKKKKKKE